MEFCSEQTPFVVYTISKIIQTAEQDILGFPQNYMAGSFIVYYNRKGSYLNNLQILKFNLTLILHLVKTVCTIVYWTLLLSLPFKI